MYTYIHRLKHSHIYKPLSSSLYHGEIDEIHKTITKYLFAYTNVILNYNQPYFGIYDILSRLGMNNHLNKLFVFHAKTGCGETIEPGNKRGTHVLHD